MTNYLITFSASFLIWLMFIGFIAIWIIGKKLESKQAIHIIYSVLIAWFISEVIKHIVPTLRPFQMTASSPLTLTTPSTSAFPSSHTAIAFGLASAILTHNKRFGLVFLVIASIVGLGRILGNVHFPADIAGGAILGSGTAFIIRRLVA